MELDMSIYNQISRIATRTDDGVASRLGEDFAVFYYISLIEHKFILENLEKPYAHHQKDFCNYLKTVATPLNMNEVQKSLIYGHIVILYESSILVVRGTMKKVGRSISEPIREASFEGGLETFVELTDTNINLIRQYYHNDKLEIKEYYVGINNPNKVTALYNSQYVDSDVLEKIATRLTSNTIPDCQSASQLQQHLLEGQWIFPRLISTERPDRSIYAINKGRIVLLLEGSSVAIIAPATFHDFFDTVDDRYLLPIPSIFLMVLRYSAFIIALLAPSLYVVISGYNPEILRIQLAISLAGSRAGVPYASFIEVLFMLLMVEYLVEASIRLPRTIGQTATTVGGLILGQGATEAGLVSNIMIIVVSSVAIATFVIPITSMNLAVRITKYYILLLSTLGGLIGFICGALSVSYYLMSIHSFNTPFYNPTNFRNHSFTAMFKRGRSDV